MPGEEEAGEAARFRIHFGFPAEARWNLYAAVGALTLDALHALMPHVPDEFPVFAFLGADAVFGILGYILYKHCEADYSRLKECPDLFVNSNLKTLVNSEPNKEIPYACVTGFTTTQEIPLKSQYSKEETGVLQHSSVTEHVSFRRAGGWFDNVRYVKSSQNVIPFELAEKRNGSGHRVEVHNPLAADGLGESMRTTYDKFLPSNNSLFDRLVGDVSKGFQENEEMLGLGVRMLGVGKLVIHNNTLRLEPPSGGHTYYLTTQSKSHLLDRLGNKVSMSATLVKLSLVIGIGLLSIIAVKQYRVWWRRREREEMARTVQELRAARDRQGETTGDPQHTVCVVCLENPREVVILDCGHICACLSCMDLIPEPQQCPMCRQNVKRIVPVFIP